VLDVTKNGLGLGLPPRHVGCMISCHIGFQGYKRTNDLFLADLGSTPNAVVGIHVECRGAHQVASTAQDATGLRPPKTLTTTKTHEIGAFFDKSSEIRHWEQHGGCIDNHWAPMGVRDFCYGR